MISDNLGEPAIPKEVMLATARERLWKELLLYVGVEKMHGKNPAGAFEAMGEAVGLFVATTVTPTHIIKDIANMTIAGFADAVAFGQREREMADMKNGKIIRAQ